MSGCFGNCKEDIARQGELNRYLESVDTTELEKKIEARQEEIYSDIEEFQKYMVYEYEGFFAIARQLNRALCMAGKTDDASIVALHDSMREMKDALDTHIAHTVEFQNETAIPKT